MGYAKERGKLENLLTRLVGINIYNEKSLAVLHDCHEKYSHTVRILKNKQPEIFIELYTNELEEIKAGKKAVREEDPIEVRQNNFIAYKDAIVRATEKTIQASLEA